MINAISKALTLRGKAKSKRLFKKIESTKSISTPYKIAKNLKTALWVLGLIPRDSPQTLTGVNLSRIAKRILQ